MKKTILNATIINDKPTGLGVYTQNVINRLFLDRDSTVICNKKSYLSDVEIDSLVELSIPKSRFAFIKRRLLVNSYLKKNIDDIELIYSPTQHINYIKGKKHIITIHDLIPLKYPKGRIHQTFYYKYIIKRYIRKVDKIITVSENTKNDVVKYYNIEPSRVKVIYNGFDKTDIINRDKSIEIIQNKYNLKDFILIVGINYKYKNLESVIKAYNEIKDEIDNKIVIVGNYNISYGKQLINLVKKLKIEDKVIFTGYVDEEEKHLFYQSAKVFIYPTLYEGFGLPILEAMSNEVPVICSSTSSIPEVAGDAAIYINPNNIDDIKDKMVKAINMGDMDKNDIIKKGKERVKHFSWSKCAKEVQDTINELLSSSL
jgi:glycosyltransferase involved in cell wall biosynthesis